MFEITGSDIAALDDKDLRLLVARLAKAELKANDCPISSVTAGGNQDAADGGIDVRVDCPKEIANPDFVKRPQTVFQVKKPDMPPSEIYKEMRPNDALRNAISELADVSGSYVIVSAQGSVADKPLADRRKAMRDALKDVPNTAQLHTDFYDRDRLATWANEYAGTAVWVRSRAGRPLSGWSGIGDWEGINTAPKPYLFSDKACLIDERSRDREHLTIATGIARLRAGLRTPKLCIRLIGLSGLGKTRLVQALFEEGVGEDPLDSSLAIYTDYSEETNPTARDIARALIANYQRAILIVDNCNPTTHSELARLCSSEVSNVSLITVEYDVREDEPEQTDVFRLQSASPELVTEWIKQSFLDISQLDRQRIAEFSDGNFRVARALAETLGKGETLGSLKSRDLFERIFRQRNEPNQQLLKCAEDLSLLYSIDGEDISDEGELARVGTIQGVGAQSLFEALTEMRRRSVVQGRGRYRAILPQAIANPLAAHALERIPPASFDKFSVALTPRMLKSVARRLGYLHDSVAAQAIVARWLRTDGPLGDLINDGFEIITLIAPVAPAAVLAKLEQELNEQNGAAVAKPYQWIPLIKAIGYDAKLFERAVILLTRFGVSEPENNNLNSARNIFSEFFHIYLSGTQAPPEQRRSMIRRLITSGDEKSRRCGHIALRALIKSDHFMSGSSYDFGARSRDFGWHPSYNKDVWDWFEDAIKLIVEIAPEQDARALLAAELRGLWRYPGCRSALENAASLFTKTRPWIEGWIACRATLRYNVEGIPEDVRAQLEQLINQLKPTDLLNQARAVILNRMPGGGGWDFADGEDDDDGAKAWEKTDRIAQEIGRGLANDAAIRSQFILEVLVEPQAARAFECGRGLAEGTEDVESLWRELVIAFGMIEPQKCNETLLGGFIFQSNERDAIFTSQALDSAVTNAELLLVLPYLQRQVGINIEGIARLRRAIALGNITASSFNSIANGSVSDSPSEPLATLIKDIQSLPDGIAVALEILSMHFLCNNKDKGVQPTEGLIAVGRDILTQLRFHEVCDYSAHIVIGVCLVGEEAKGAAETVCANIRAALENYSVWSHDLNYSLATLFEAQPLVALDTFLQHSQSHYYCDLFDVSMGRKNPLDNLDPAILRQWAGSNSDVHYPLLGKCIKMFNNEGNDINPLFLLMLEDAPDKRLFLGSKSAHLHPQSGGGSLADILIGRKAQLMKFAEHPDADVRSWVADSIPELEQWIEHERGRDRLSEESFE